MYDILVFLFHSPDDFNYFSFQNCFFQKLDIWPNIKISLKQHSSIFKTLTTDENGYFELMEIPVGEYEIVLED